MNDYRTYMSEEEALEEERIDRLNGKVYGKFFDEAIALREDVLKRKPEEILYAADDIKFLFDIVFTLDDGFCELTEEQCNALLSMKDASEKIRRSFDRMELEYIDYIREAIRYVADDEIRSRKEREQQNESEAE